MALTAAACGSQSPPSAAPAPVSSPGSGTPPPVVRPPGVPAAPGQPLPGPPGGTPRSPATERRYAVGLRSLQLHRGAGRPLPTLIFYPAVGPAALGAQLR